MRVVLQSLFRQTLARIALDRVIPAQIRREDAVLSVGDAQTDLTRYARLFIVAFGKAAFQMVDALVPLLAPRVVSGVASGIGAPDRTLPGFVYFGGGHPYPNASSFQAGDAVIDLLRQVTEHDLVIYLLSGGGSAICERSLFPEIEQRDHQELNKLLVTCGLNVVDINCIRKHFSAIKGGRLAECAFPARQITLYVSDVPPGNPSSVASGPTLPDESSADDCYRIVRDRKLMPRLPASIRRVFEERRIPETPKPGAEIFRTSSWHCLLAPEDAVAVMTEEARQLGWIVEPDSSMNDDWPLDRVVQHLLERLDRLRQEHVGQTVAIVTGGEYSCPVTGEGLGGRNQAFVLECASRISTRQIAVLSAGTDGVDGNSVAAGAVADGTTLARAQQAGLDPVDSARRSDSYGFLSSLNDTLLTGPTGNNVRDLRILVAW